MNAIREPREGKSSAKIYFQYQRVESFIVKPFGKHWLGRTKRESHKYYSIGFEIQFTFTRTNDESLLATISRAAFSSFSFLLHNNNLLNPSTSFRANGIGAKTKQKKETSSVRRRATYWNQIVRKLSLNGTHDDMLSIRSNNGSRGKRDNNMWRSFSLVRVAGSQCTRNPFMSVPFGVVAT